MHGFPSCAVLQVLDSAVASVCPKAELIAAQAVAGPAERALYRAYAVPSLFGRDTLECGPFCCVRLGSVRDQGQWPFRLLGDVRVTEVCALTEGHTGELSCRFIVRESGAADRRWRGDSQRPIVTYRSMAGGVSIRRECLFAWMYVGQDVLGVHST